MVGLDVHVGIYDRELGALFQEKKMSKTVVYLMVTQRYDIR